jgi:hypothetical protein
VGALAVENEQNKQLLGTPTIRDALVALSAHATTARACEAWCVAVWILANNEQNQLLLGTRATRDALVALSTHAITASACREWCAAVRNLAFNDDNKKLLGSKEMLVAQQTLKHVSARKPAARRSWDRAASVF